MESRDRPAGGVPCFRLLMPGSRRRPDHSPDFFFFSRRKTLLGSEEKQARESAPSSTGAAIHGVPAGGPRPRRRRCAIRTNEGTLKGTRLRWFFAADGPPARGAGTPRRAALASENGARQANFSVQTGPKGASSPAPLDAFLRRFTTLAREPPAASAGARPRRAETAARAIRRE